MRLHQPSTCAGKGLLTDTWRMAAETWQPVWASRGALFLGFHASAITQPQAVGQRATMVQHDGGAVVRSDNRSHKAPGRL